MEVLDRAHTQTGSHDDTRPGPSLQALYHPALNRGGNLPLGRRQLARSGGALTASRFCFGNNGFITIKVSLYHFPTSRLDHRAAYLLTKRCQTVCLPIHMRSHRSAESYMSVPC